jgi:putative transposase
VIVGHTTINKILRINDLIKPHKPRKQRTFIRWERAHPNSLWQTDYSIYKRKYITAFIDDHSRFCTAGNVFSEATTQHSLELLNQAIHDYNKPRQILTDHGSQYYSVKGGISEFDKQCNYLGIQHIMSGIGRPTTQGKIERFFQTIKKTMNTIPDIQEAIQYYNYVKPHKSLQYQTPAQVYLKK